MIDLVRELGVAGVACSIPDEVLRFSPHWPNDLGQVADVVGAVDPTLARLRAGV